MSFLSCLFFYLLFVHLSYGVDCLLIQNITEARADLCPYVGYSGAICTGLDEKQPRVASVYQQLPRGVGMTLDITSGALLLPAMEYTYPHTTSWTDPVTNQTYWVPQEVSLSSVSTDENQPVARVFLTSLELSNEWKYERLRGKWLGGEFGHSKSMLDIQSRFFSNNQATAVTQKPEVLYRLRVENLQLNNFYAQRRKILLDHRLGGDPSVDQNNETLWRTTLATNPALLKIEQYTPWYEISAITDPAINQESITDKMTLCIHNNFECGTKHNIRIKAKRKNGTETYRSDLIYFTVPSVEEKQNGEYIYIRNESIPPTIQGVITSDEDTDEEQPEPQRNKFKERALELLQKLENQILLGRTSVM
ncbi:unnamed protein product [Rotaria sp. Silwood1]|nr:unnamed protein product [Rotaria sp. Silwood1]